MSRGNVEDLENQIEELLKQVKASVKEVTAMFDNLDASRTNIKDLSVKLADIQRKIEYLERLERELEANSSSDSDEDDDDVSSKLAAVRRQLNIGRAKRTEVQNKLTAEKKKKEQYEEQLRQLQKIFLEQYWQQQEKIKEEAEAHEKDLSKAISDLPKAIVRSSSLDITGGRVADLQEKEATAKSLIKQCDTLDAFLKKEGEVIDQELSAEKGDLEK